MSKNPLNQIQLDEDIQRLRADAQRYRWLRDRKQLDLRTDGWTSWTREDGTTFRGSHRLSADDTGYSSAETLDELIDFAMGIDKK
jgi:hypothetical protein